jgi:A/G-specific adenine glycosylase
MDNALQQLKQLPQALLPWYDAHRRSLPLRDQVSPYRTWVSEIMLQQTRVAAVIPYFQRFMEAFPTAEALAAADTEQLMKLWEGLGYYSSARNLQKAAQIIAQKGSFPDTYEEVLALPGIGDYTAGAILSIAFGQSIPAVDGNVLRVMSRITGSEDNILDAKTRGRFRALTAQIIPPDRPGEFNQALMDLGATVCLPNGEPLCA